MRWRDDYDCYFKQFSHAYFGPEFDWRWFKAQGIAESGLNPNAVSPAGAMGVMQIMPATWRDIKAVDAPDEPFTPRINIAHGIYYSVFQMT